MEKKEHKYAQVLRWIADGEKVQQNIKGEWVSLIPNRVLSLIAGHNILVDHFRIKPKTIMIGDVECEAPVLNPKAGQDVWLMTPEADRIEFSYMLYNAGHHIHESLARNGLFFASKEAALKAGAAITKLLTQQ